MNEIDFFVFWHALRQKIRLEIRHFLFLYLREMLFNGRWGFAFFDDLQGNFFMLSPRSENIGIGSVFFFFFLEMKEGLPEKIILCHEQLTYNFKEVGHSKWWGKKCERWGYLMNRCIMVFGYSVIVFIIINMNILSSEEMREIQEQLLKVTLPPQLQLRLPSISQPHNSIALISQAPESTQLEIKKIVSLADNISSLPLTDANSTLKVFTVTILSILYQGRYRGNATADHSLLQAIKCSLFSPDVNLTIIKGAPSTCTSNHMKASAAIFFAFMSQQEQNFAAESFHTAQLILHDNEHLFNCFILFFRCILQAIEIEGAGSWKSAIEEKTGLENLLDYFDLSYRQIGDMFLLYEQGLFLSVTQREIVYGQYFENQREKQNEKKQMEIKSSVKRNMVESFLVSANNDDRPSKKKNGIVDSDLKLFNFMLESSQDEQEEKISAHGESQTPHFKENELFHFGKKKKEDNPQAYRPQEVRFQFEKLIKDESMQEIQPDDLINFNAQFQEAPTPFLGGQFQFAKTQAKSFDNPNSVNERSFSNKNIPISNSIYHQNRMSLADQKQMNVEKKGIPENRLKKATTQISPHENHMTHSSHNNKNYTIKSLHSCFCRQVRASRNMCVSKVVQYSFVPLNIARRQFFNSKNLSFKANPRTVTEGKSYTLNKQSTFKEKKSPIPQDRTPSFLKNIKKQNSNNPIRPERNSQEVYPASAQEIGSREKVTQEQGRRQTNPQQSPQQHQFKQKGKPRDDQALTKMKFSDNQQTSSKKFQIPSRGALGQSSSNWQTSSNFHQRQLTSTSPLNHAKSSFIPPNSQPKNVSPLKFFAPVQIIAPTVYLNSNGNDSSNNIVFKLSDLHENSPKIMQRQPQSPFASMGPSTKSQNPSQNPLIK